MSAASLQSFANSYSPFSSRKQPNRMPQSQTSGLDTLAEGSQYALEQLQLARQAGTTSHAPTDADGKSPTEPDLPQSQAQKGYNEQNGSHLGGKDSSHSRDMLAEARSTIRKSSSTPVRRRISRACDQCNQLRTKCDGQLPCAHCIGSVHRHRDGFLHWSLTYFRVRTRLRICARAQETRQGLEESSGCGSSRGGV